MHPGWLTFLFSSRSMIMIVFQCFYEILPKQESSRFCNIYSKQGEVYDNILSRLLANDKISNCFLRLL